MRQPPLNMGDVFVVDDGDLGITVRKKGSKTFQEILDAWPEEQEKMFAYGDGNDYETVNFFNGKGAVALAEWLEGRKEAVPA